MTRDFREALRQADQAHAKAGMSARTDRRLRQRLGLAGAAGASAARPWRWLSLAAAGAAAVALFFALRPGPRTPDLAGFALREPSADFAARVAPDGVVSVSSGTGTLVDQAEGVSLAVRSAGAAVRKEPRGVRVVAGTFETSVARRAPGSVPCRVLVSHGDIEVLGTRFTLVQRPDGSGGSVSLHEGSIRFVADDGRAVPLSPGQRLDWPLEPPRVAAAPPPAAWEPQPPPPPSPKPPASTLQPAAPARPLEPSPQPAPGEALEPEAQRIEKLLERLDELRSRGQYGAAAAELEKALVQAGYGEATRERLSFELGIILSRPGSDGARACRHWRDHAASFPHGRYDREIEQAVERLRCAGP